MRAARRRRFFGRLHAEPAHEQQRKEAADGKFEPGLDAQGIKFWQEGELLHALQHSIGDATPHAHAGFFFVKGRATSQSEDESLQL